MAAERRRRRNGMEFRGGIHPRAVSRRPERGSGNESSKADGLTTTPRVRDGDLTRQAVGVFG